MSDFEMASIDNIVTFLLDQESFPPVSACDGVTIRQWLFRMNIGLSRNALRRRVGRVIRALQARTNVTPEEAEEQIARMGGVGDRGRVVFSSTWRAYCLVRTRADVTEELPFHEFDADEDEDMSSDGSEYEHEFHDFAADEEPDLDVSTAVGRQ